VSVPFCVVSIFIGWLVLVVVYHFDRSPDERLRDLRTGGALTLSRPVFEKEAWTSAKVFSIILAIAGLLGFSCTPVSIFFGGVPNTAVLLVAVAIGSGAVTRRTFNSYSWHLLFLIGGGNALGLCVRDSGLLLFLANVAKSSLSNDPSMLIVQLVLIMLVVTTFVSHTVAALVLMPLIVELGVVSSENIAHVLVLLAALSCSISCSVPMTSFPNLNSLLATDDLGQPWLKVNNFIKAGLPAQILQGAMLLTFGYWLCNISLSDVPKLHPIQATH